MNSKVMDKENSIFHTRRSTSTGNSLAKVSGRHNGSTPVLKGKLMNQDNFSLAVPRKALGDVGNAPGTPAANNNVIAKKSMLKEVKPLHDVKQPCKNLQKNFQDDISWPDVEYQLLNDPDTDEDEIWARIGLDRLTLDDVEMFHALQPEKSFYTKRPDTPSPPPEPEILHFPFVDQAVGYLNEMDNHLDFTFDDRELMFIPLD